MSVRAGNLTRQSVIRTLQEKAFAGLHGLGGDAPFCLVDFPNHANVGDSAIWLGARAFFREHRAAEARYVCSLAAYSEAALRAAAPEGPIFMHGGGNFGDVWPRHQEFRERILQRFPDREVIQLPQSIHFAEPKGITSAARTIARHGRFRLCVRDQPSYELATTHFDCEVRLCPDLAVCLGPLDRERPPEVDILYLLRTDRESAIEAAPALVGHRSRVVDWMVENRLSIKAHKLFGAVGELRRGWPGRAALRGGWYDAAARARLARGCRLLSSGRVVITDRLHAHILSLLLGLPHAVLDNSYGKLSRFLDLWTGQAAGVYRASSLEDAERWAASQLESS